jgi:hypothetical protein
VLIRVPCYVAENLAGKSMQMAAHLANPLFKPLSRQGKCGHVVHRDIIESIVVRAIDDYAVQKIRQIESKYPSITTPTDEVVQTLNDKTDTVRQAMSSVKETTTSTIEHGKQTVRCVRVDSMFSHPCSSTFRLLMSPRQL